MIWTYTQCRVAHNVWGTNKAKTTAATHSHSCSAVSMTPQAEYNICAYNPLPSQQSCASAVTQGYQEE